MKQKFEDIPQGTHFSDGRAEPRKFIKLQTVLPSGCAQTIHREVAGVKLSGNAIDYKGTLANCPDWLEFEILDPQPKSV
jgi:hypothetical protein